MLKFIRKLFPKFPDDKNIAGRRSFLKVATAVVLSPLISGFTEPARKLKAVWGVEAAYDLKSVHNIEAEAELTAVLARELMEEIDREILADLRMAANGNPPAWVEKMAA